MSDNETVIEVFIEIPKGSRNKYEYDKERGIIRFDRMLFSAVHYPSDYGFVTETMAKDGDSLDALVLVAEHFPGCIIDAIPVGLFMMHDEKGQDEKILCVPKYDPLWNNVKSLKMYHLICWKKLNIFSIYKDLERKEVFVDGWKDKKEAIKVIKTAQQRYIELLKANDNKLEC